jgi:hypothetical protein
VKYLCRWELRAGYARRPGRPRFPVHGKTVVACDNGRLGRFVERSRGESIWPNAMGSSSEAEANLVPKNPLSPSGLREFVRAPTAGHNVPEARAGRGPTSTHVGKWQVGGPLGRSPVAMMRGRGGFPAPPRGRLMRAGLRIYTLSATFLWAG